MNKQNKSKKVSKLMSKKVFIFLLMVVACFEPLLWSGVNVKAGPMLTKMDLYYYAGFSGPTPKTLPGYRAEVSWSIPLMSNSSLEAGVSFGNEGVKYYESSLDHYANVRVNFFKCNLLLNFRLVPSRFHVLAGSYFAVRVGKEKNGSIELERFTAESKNGFGGLLGFRYYFKSSNRKNTGLFLEVLGDVGFRKFRNVNSGGIIPSYRSQNVSLMLGYSF